VDAGASDPRFVRRDGFLVFTGVIATEDIPDRRARRVHLIWDGGSAHVADETTTWLRQHYPRVRTLVTPPHSSWLNQAELLLRAFTERYPKRGDWKSRQLLIDHLDASWREYNERYAHPIAWSWTRQKMRRWAERHAPRPC
jgi:hypothetical protein